MSGHKYLSDPNNLFEDVDDETFLRNSRPKQSSNLGYSNNYQQNTSYRDVSDLEHHKQTLLDRKREIEERTLQSSQRSLGLLRDSEQIGIATAEELMRQREQLENSSKRLDEINTTLRFSQKHINGIKSVFGSLKNYLSGQKDSPRNITPSSSSTKLSDAVSEARPQSAEEMYQNHPATRLRGFDNPESSNYPGYQSNEQSGSRNMNAMLEANLEEMCGNISRLKGLATGLGEEIMSQNDLLDDITEKTDQAGITIEKQTKSMNKLMK